MQKRHFEAIAAALKAAEPPHTEGNAWSQWEFDVRSITNAIRQFNPLFDGARFLKACGLE